MKRKYSEEDCRFLADVIPGKSYNEIISLYNAAFDNPLTKLQLKGFIANHGVKTGPPSRYVKGHTPNNKGQHGPQYGYKPTYFKKGNISGKYLPVGSTRVNAHGHIKIKVADPNKWRMAHVLLWEASNGPIPKGYTLIFGDGNKQNITMENLVLVSRGELLVMNRFGLKGGNADLTRACVSVVDLIMKIKQRKTEGYDGKE